MDGRLVDRTLVVCYVSDELDVRKKRLIRDKVRLCRVFDVFLLMLKSTADALQSQSLSLLENCSFFTINSIGYD